MSFITKNANLLLLLLIVISAVGLVGATVYFQSNFEKINANYQAKLIELNKVSKDLQAQKTLLENITSVLSLNQQREAEFTGKYTDIRSQNDNLSKSNQDLEVSKEKLTSSLSDAQDAQAKAEAALGDVQSQLRDVQGRLTQAESDAATYRSSYESCSNQLSNAHCNAFTSDSGNCACNLIK